MNIKQAVFDRISRRKFEKTPLEQVQIEQLDAALWEINKVGDLKDFLPIN